MWKITSWRISATHYTLHLQGQNVLHTVASINDINLRFYVQSLIRANQITHGVRQVFAKSRIIH